MVVSHSLIWNSLAFHISSIVISFFSGFVVTLLMVTWADLGVNFLKERWEEVGIVYATFSSSFSTNGITLLSIGSIRSDNYTFTHLFRSGFRSYTKMSMASSFASLGSATTILSNAEIYSCIEPHYCGSCSLSLAIFLSSNGVYWLINSFSNYGNLFGAFLWTSKLSIYLASLPPINIAVY